MVGRRVVYLGKGELPDRDLIGGKAWSLGRMLDLGLRVPPAFVIPASECQVYLDAGRTIDDDLWRQVLEAVAYLELSTGRQFGNPQHPLLVSVRSGAAVSMPGMMDTVLNIGITDEIEAGLAHVTGDPAYARDTHARFCHQYSDIVLKAMLDPYQRGLSAEKVRALALADCGSEIPRTPQEQLRGAISAVFDSWNSSRAKAYRRHWGIEGLAGTAVTVQAMVFGNLGERSGTGVLFSRNPLSGAPSPYGEWLPRGQGDDVVGGTHAVQDIVTLEQAMPEAHAELMEWAAVLERETGDVQDIEFTIEEGQLYLLQTRSAKRSPHAALRIAVDMVAEGLLTEAEALSRITPTQVGIALMPKLDPAHSGQHIVATGEPACPGVACGVGVVDPDEAERRSAAGESVVLVRPTTSPNDVHGMIAAVAVVTDLGGSTSHAAVVTRALGRPSVVGVGDGVAEQLAGRLLTVDGAGGHVYEGEMPLVRISPADDPVLSRLARWAEDLCPVRVVASAVDAGGSVLDLDQIGFGVSAETPTFSVADLAEVMSGVAAVRGSLMSTAEGMRAALAVEVPYVIAQPVLPVQVLAFRTAAGIDVGQLHRNTARGPLAQEA